VEGGTPADPILDQQYPGVHVLRLDGGQHHRLD
jgi:hypothetical protein